MAARKPKNIDPRALKAGVASYRKVFHETGEAGLHVLADFENYCRASEAQTSFEQMANEERTDHDRYRDHVALVGFFRYIMNNLEITDEDIETYEREFRARLQGEE